jgi:hypothetical protein
MDLEILGNNSGHRGAEIKIPVGMVAKRYEEKVDGGGGRSGRRELVQSGFGKHSIWEKALYSDVLAVIKKCGAIVGL